MVGEADGMAGVDIASSTDGASISMGMPEFVVVVEMKGEGSAESSVTGGGASASLTRGAGEGVGEGGRCSCTGGVGESAKVAGTSSSKGGVVESKIGVVSMMSLTKGGVGESNGEVGGGSMTGVVHTNKEVGTDSGAGRVGGSDEEVGWVSMTGVVADSSVGEGAVSSGRGMAESVDGSIEFMSGMVESSALARSVSVAHGVEDSRCSLLASMMHSLSRAVIGVMDEGEMERPLASLAPGLPGWTSVEGGTDISMTVRSTAEEAVESMVDTAVAAASWRGVSWTRV